MTELFFVHQVGRVGLTLKHDSKVLVAGCGDGSEALRIYEVTQAKVVGIDKREEFNVFSDNIVLKNGDITKLPFEDGWFDACYCHHVLEHVNNPFVAIQELNRVLSSNGVLFIGIPNKTRLIGYLGSKVSIKQKIYWNLLDYYARLKKQFENKYGAHAGFTKEELTMLLKSFSQVIDITNEYYIHKYPNFRFLTLLKTNRLLPSLYFIAKK